VSGTRTRGSATIRAIDRPDFPEGNGPALYLDFLGFSITSSARIRISPMLRPRDDDSESVCRSSGPWIGVEQAKLVRHDRRVRSARANS